MSTINERKKLFAETVVPTVEKHGFVEMELSPADVKTVKTHWYNWRRMQRIGTGQDPAEHIVLRVTATGLYFSLARPTVLANAIESLREQQQALETLDAQRT